jgi:hypothetical protein
MRPLYVPRVRIWLAVCIGLSALARVAHAERPWLFDVTLSTEIGLDSGNAGEPVSIAPDIGVLTKGPRIEIIHSSVALTGFHGLPRGTGLCVSGDLCDALEFYHTGGIELSYVLRSHARGDSLADGINHTAIAVHGGLIANTFDPFALSLKLGVRAGYLTNDYVHFELVPSVHVALTERDAQGDRIFVPFTTSILPSTDWSLQLETGIAGPLDGFEENVQVPLGLNITVRSNERVELLASYSFPAVLGGDAIDAGFDARVLTVGLRWSKFLGGDPQ